MTDELKEVILKLQGNEGKIRTILNKADQVSQWELICVYRTITWYMSKDLRRPALISSFWKELFNVQSKEARRHLEQEKNQTRLTCCAKSALLLKGKEMLKRGRLLRAHASVCATPTRQNAGMVWCARLAGPFACNPGPCFPRILEAVHHSPRRFPRRRQEKTDRMD